MSKKKTRRFIKKYPVVYIPQEILAQMDAYIAAAEGEISGLGAIEKYGQQDFLVSEIFLFKQVCSDAKTSLNRHLLGEFMREMNKLGRKPGEFKLWWHSHWIYTASWSIKDEESIEGLKCGWMVSVVRNIYGDTAARLDVFDPVRATDHSLSVRVVHPMDDELLQAAKKEVAEKVTFIKKPPAAVAMPLVPQVGAEDFEGEWDD